MRFLVDAQLPARLASRLVELGHDAVHTSSLPDGNRTTDQQIAAVADRDGRIVVTKDADFRNSHLLFGSPAGLLVVATGNIRNDDLLKLFESCLAEIEEAFALGVMSSSGEALSFRIHARSPEVPGPWPTTKIESIAGRGEIVRKLDRSAVNSQVTAWAASFCKSVAV